MKKKEPRKYGLLVGVSRYQEESRSSLPAAGEDLRLMKSALTDGLKFDTDDIRVLGEAGTVPAKSFARALSEFEGMICPEDIFVLYFSGHGTTQGLCFSDSVVDLQSIVDFVERLSAGSKIVLFDCCYAGDVRLSGRGDLSFEEIVSVFAGRGMDVMASSAADERSGRSEKRDASVAPQSVAAAC